MLQPMYKQTVTDTKHLQQKLLSVLFSLLIFIFTCILLFSMNEPSSMSLLIMICLQWVFAEAGVAPLHDEVN